MPQTAPYIPSKDALVKAWMANFAALVTAAPATYGLTAGDAVVIQAASDAFGTAYDTAIEPTTRTKPSVAAKDAARESALATLRPYAQEIRNNLGVSNELKLGLGLTIPDLSPTPIPAPTTVPLLTAPAVATDSVVLRFADQTTPDKRSKPWGVTALQVVGIQLETVPPDPAALPTLANVTKQPYLLSTAGMEGGTPLHLWGRWVTRRGLVGPWSERVEVYVNPA